MESVKLSSMGSTLNAPAVEPAASASFRRFGFAFRLAVLAVLIGSRNS